MADRGGFGEFVNEDTCPDCGHSWDDDHIIDAPVGWREARAIFVCVVWCLTCDCHGVVTAVPKEAWN